MIESTEKSEIRCNDAYRKKKHKPSGAELSNLDRIHRNDGNLDQCIDAWRIRNYQQSVSAILIASTGTSRICCTDACRTSQHRQSGAEHSKLKCIHGNEPNLVLCIDACSNVDCRITVMQALWQSGSGSVRRLCACLGRLCAGLWRKKEKRRKRKFQNLNI